MNFLTLTQDIENDWKQYFRWSIVYPSIFFFVSFILLIMVILLSFTGMSHTIGLLLSFVLVILVLPLGMLMLGFMAWFILSSHQWFKIFGLNLFISNFINIILVFSGFHFITVLFLHFKMKKLRENNK